MNKSVLVIGIAILIGVSGCKSNPVQTGGGNLSSSYSFKSGHGTINWNPMVRDHNNYVARDWNGDGKSDVLALPSIYASLPNGATSYFQPYAFLSNPDGSYSVVTVGGQPINNTAGEWNGDYFAPSGPIVVGNGPGTSNNPALIYNGLVGTAGPTFRWHGQATADINKDGHLDLAGHMGGTTIYLGDGTGGFHAGPLGFHPGNGEYVDLGALSMNTGAFAGTFMDLNGDGYPEMITGSYWNVTPHSIAGGAVANGGITVWKNNGGTSFSVMQQLPSGIAGRIGNRAIYSNARDVIVYSECGDDCGANSWIRVYGTSEGGLNLKQQFNINSSNTRKGHAPLLVDVNGDNKNDLIVNHLNNYAGNVGSQHSGIWLNNGNGTFSQLVTPIFAGIPKSDLKGIVVPVHANSDSRMDWIVMYQDGTFGSLLAPGVTVSNSSSGTSSSVENKTRVPIADIGRGDDRFWQLSFVGRELRQMSENIVNSNTMFSFSDIQMHDAFSVNEEIAFTFGAIPADKHGDVDNIVVGMAIGGTRVAVATDDSLLGYDTGQSLLNVANSKTRYINVRHSENMATWGMSANMTYANVQGSGSYGYVKDVDTFHAIGFGVDISYTIDDNNGLNFRLSQPLRIESGALHFDGVIADMSPTGREIDYVISYTSKLSETNEIKLKLSYSSDVNHFQGEDNTKMMMVYKGIW